MSNTEDIPNSSNSSEEIDGRAGVIISDLEENIKKHISWCNMLKLSY